ncbi:hypothetical protein DVR12_22550 [Chitinophaga silvatica]|uniref:Uncharacterized protein n=1 Tax=Chitinophaga silvatica TaxID=2282649 RepID=A0A3E1Y413_9BACT|nr:hypothetical protein [Chitinophaga silvatica]RFS19418.1 hypothetical protein DVR12_22550 [Chitinophaga silvatica]
MKKSIKIVTAFFATLVLLVGINISLSSYGISLKEITALSLTDTGTGTSPEIVLDNAVFVGGEDCSWKVPSYDTETGKILGYTTYTANQSVCKVGSSTCNTKNERPCLATKVEYKPVENN